MIPGSQGLLELFQFSAHFCIHRSTKLSKLIVTVVALINMSEIEKHQIESCLEQSPSDRKLFAQAGFALPEKVVAQEVSEDYYDIYKLKQQLTEEIQSVKLSHLETLPNQYELPIETFESFMDLAKRLGKPVPKDLDSEIASHEFEQEVKNLAQQVAASLQKVLGMPGVVQFQVDPISFVLVFGPRDVDHYVDQYGLHAPSNEILKQTASQLVANLYRAGFTEEAFALRDWVKRYEKKAA